MLSDPALILAIVLMAPLMAAILVIDTRDLRIPNWSVLAVIAVFLATGSWGLPFDVFLWRILYGVLALLAGFLVYNLAQGGIGAGDLKLLAALAPFLSAANLFDFAVVYALVSVVGTLAFWLIRRALRGREHRWKAFGPTIYFPAGVFIGVTITVVLIGEAAARFA